MTYPVGSTTLKGHAEISPYHFPLTEHHNVATSRSEVAEFEVNPGSAFVRDFQVAADDNHIRNTGNEHTVCECCRRRGDLNFSFRQDRVGKHGTGLIEQRLRPGPSNQRTVLRWECRCAEVYVLRKRRRLSVTRRAPN
jgi:hypothetical protein